MAAAHVPEASMHTAYQTHQKRQKLIDAVCGFIETKCTHPDNARELVARLKQALQPKTMSASDDAPFVVDPVFEPSRAHDWPPLKADIMKELHQHLPAREHIGLSAVLDLFDGDVPVSFAEDRRRCLMPAANTHAIDQKHIDPVTFEPMAEPCLNEKGGPMFDRATLEQWLQTHPPKEDGTYTEPCGTRLELKLQDVYEVPSHLVDFAKERNPNKMAWTMYLDYLKAGKTAEDRQTLFERLADHVGPGALTCLPTGQPAPGNALPKELLKQLETDTPAEGEERDAFDGMKEQSRLNYKAWTALKRKFGPMARCAGERRHDTDESGTHDLGAQRRYEELYLCATDIVAYANNFDEPEEEDEEPAAVDVTHWPVSRLRELAKELGIQVSVASTYKSKPKLVEEINDARRPRTLQQQVRALIRMFADDKDDHLQWCAEYLSMVPRGHDVHPEDSSYWTYCDCLRHMIISGDDSSDRLARTIADALPLETCRKALALPVSNRDDLVVFYSRYIANISARPSNAEELANALNAAGVAAMDWPASDALKHIFPVYAAAVNVWSKATEEKCKLNKEVPVNAVGWLWIKLLWKWRQEHATVDPLDEAAPLRSATTPTDQRLAYLAKAMMDARHGGSRNLKETLETLLHLNSASAAVGLCLQDDACVLYILAGFTQLKHQARPSLCLAPTPTLARRAKVDQAAAAGHRSAKVVQILYDLHAECERSFGFQNGTTIPGYCHAAWKRATFRHIHMRMYVEAQAGSEWAAELLTRHMSSWLADEQAIVQRDLQYARQQHEARQNRQKRQREPAFDLDEVLRQTRPRRPTTAD